MNHDQNPLKAGLAKSVSSGLQGEEISARAVLHAIGGVRGVVETLLPGLLYLVIFVLSQDIKLSVIAPVITSVIFVALRIFSKQPVVPALSGFVGVLIAVFATLFTGKGEGYFLPGFWINGVWGSVLLISILVRHPLIGYLAGLLQNDIGGWRKNKKIFTAANIATGAWVALFALRLAVQLPFYFAGNVAALGVARLAMGTPLFALLIIFTWLLFRNTMRAPQSK